MEPLKFKKVILCEGIEDAAAIRALLVARNIPQTADIRALRDVCGSGGNGAFARAIVALDAETTFDHVDKVMVVADNDEDPTASFQGVVSQLKDARNNFGLTRKWGVPTAPCAPSTKGDPSVIAWMWPGPTDKGCLETALWPGIAAAYPAQAACAQAAVACSGASAWTVSKANKSLTRCFLSLTCEVNPGLTLARVWESPTTGSLVPLDHSSLDSFAQFLAAF